MNDQIAAFDYRCGVVFQAQVKIRACWRQNIFPFCSLRDQRGLDVTAEKSSSSGYSDFESRQIIIGKSDGAVDVPRGRAHVFMTSSKSMPSACKSEISIRWTNSSKVVVGFQPSFVLALEASPLSTSTSAGR